MGPNDGNWMAAGEHTLEQADADRTQQARDEEIRRCHEHASRLANASKVDQSDERQDPETQSKGMRLEVGCGGHQRAYSGRDTNRDHQDVIDDESRGCQQGHFRPQIFAGHGVRPTTSRIRLNSLPV